MIIFKLFSIAVIICCYLTIFLPVLWVRLCPWRRRTARAIRIRRTSSCSSAPTTASWRPARITLAKAATRRPWCSPRSPSPRTTASPPQCWRSCTATRDSLAPEEIDFFRRRKTKQISIFSSINLCRYYSVFCKFMLQIVFLLNSFPVHN